MALAWTRSALSLAVTGTLIARAAFTAGANALGVVSAIATAIVVLATWRHGLQLYDKRSAAGAPPSPQPRALGVLTGITVASAVAATIMTVSL